MSVSLLGANEIRELAAELDVTPTKKLGQNFVHDPGTVRRIVQTAKVRAGEHILEVGPGLGSLTLGLLEAGASVTAIEIDERLAARLPQTVAEHAPGAQLDVIVSDALQVQDVPGEPVALVANLPYNVSVPVLLHLLERLPSLERGVVMVQAEVGERIVAGPGSKVYGSPSVKAAWYGSWSSAGLVGRKVFCIVDAAFGQRRKMLRQALSPLLGENAAATSLVLEASGIDPTARGETVGIDDYVRLAEAWQPEA